MVSIKFRKAGALGSGTDTFNGREMSENSRIVVLSLPPQLVLIFTGTCNFSKGRVVPEREPGSVALCLPSEQLKKVFLVLLVDPACFAMLRT